jgi:hypothetical protein
VDRIFCGHTHVASHQNRYGVDYYNSGSWIDANPTYLTIDEEGVQIRQYEGKKFEPAALETDVEFLPVGELLDPVATFAGYESVRC